MRRTLGLPRAGAGVVFAIAMVVAQFVAAPSASAESLIEVEGAVGDQFVPGDPAIVLVTVTSDRLISGTLRAVDQFGIGTETERTIEVPADSPTTFVLDLDTIRWNEQTSIRVRLIVDDEVEAAATADLTYRSNLAVVGVLAQLAESPDLELPIVERIATTGGSAAIDAVNPLLLAPGSRAIDAFDIFAGTAEDLATFTPAQTQSFIGWLDAGGILLVDEAVGEPVPMLPDEWQPGGAGYSLAGFGEVHLTDGAIAEGRWGDVLVPPSIRSQSDQESLGFWFNEAVPVDLRLAREAGFELPSVNRLTTLIGGYVLVGGPVLFVLLTIARRRAWVWLLGPLVALGAGALIWQLGDEVRAIDATSHASWIWQHPVGADAQSTVLVSSRNGGEAGLALPDGWGHEAGSGDNFAPVALVEADGVLSRELLPGQAGSVTAAGPASNAPALALTATTSDDDPEEVVGTVTNVSSDVAREVAVFAGGWASPVGDLKPGESADFVVDTGRANQDQSLVQAQAWPEAFKDEQQMWQWLDPTIDQPDAEIGPVSLNMWTSFARTVGVQAQWSNRAFAVGWTKDVPTELAPSGGGQIVRGTTAQITSAAIEGTDRLVGRQTAVKFVVGPRDLPFGGENGNPVQLRLLPPPTVGDGRPIDLDRLEIEIPRRFQDPSVLVGGIWIGLEGAEKVFALPPEAITNHSVMVRGSLPWDGGQGSAVPRLREAVADAEPAPFVQPPVPPDDPEAAAAEIEKAFVGVWNGGVELADAIQYGELLPPRQNLDPIWPRADGVDRSLQDLSIEFRSPERAVVAFSLGKEGLRVNATALLIDGRWLVSADSYCDPLDIGATGCPEAILAKIDGSA